ncbi:MAG: PilZ domain-containing protein [Nitrospirae bacterium]|nr:PilZ domain-containing protein [Nitrospirota bacterium]
MGQEHRKFKRFATDIMKINGKMMFASTVDIIDISLGGISLQIDRTLKMGSEYMLRIETKDRSISVKGAVIWSTLSGSRKTAEGDVVPLYSVGMRFDDLASEKINTLIKFIESYKAEKDSVELHSLSGLRVNMRFHVVANGKFILTCPEDFSVKKISLGGMLIESENALELDQQWPMEITLPGDSEISFAGRVASCIPIETAETKRFAIGVEFLNMPEENTEKLTGFIGTLS